MIIRPDWARVRAVSFDMGETLVRPFPSFHGVFRRVCARNGVRLTPRQAATIEEASRIRTIDYQRHGFNISDTTESSKLFWTSLYRDTLVEFGVDGSRIVTLPEVIYDEFTHARSYRLFYDARPALRAAKKRGYKVGILSNWEPWLMRMIGELDLTPLLDFVIVSGEVGVEKPDRRIFELAAAKAEVAPSEIVHVGDSVHHDVIGAADAGMMPVLLDRHGRHPEAEAKFLRISTLRCLFSVN